MIPTPEELEQRQTRLSDVQQVAIAAYAAGYLDATLALQGDMPETVRLSIQGAINFFDSHLTGLGVDTSRQAMNRAWITEKDKL
jgi:hypothetical protein